MASTPMSQMSISAEQLRDEILKMLPDGALWLKSPNRRLCGRTPEQAIADGDLEVVQNVLYSIVYIGVV